MEKLSTGERNRSMRECSSLAGCVHVLVADWTMWGCEGEVEGLMVTPGLRKYHVQ